MVEEKDFHTVILETTDLGIGYKVNRKTHILHNHLSLALHRGDLVCIVGPNGSGKSTLLRTISGLQSALEGTVHINGIRLPDLNFSERSKLLSIVLTEKTAVENISVGEIVGLGRYADTNWLGVLNKHDLQIIRSSLQMVGLENFGDRFYGTLSDGEKQRTFIAKALASNAPIMLLDEPTAHLDIPNRVEIMSLLRKLTHENHKSVLVSTHDLDLAMQLADEIWLLEKDNHIVCTTPEEAISSGIINDCFGNEAVEFHPELGRFVIKSKPRGSINVAGEGPDYELTRKALERIGFSTGTKNTASTIHVEKQNWTLNYNDNSYKAKRLTDIIRLVRKHIKP